MTSKNTAEREAVESAAATSARAVDQLIDVSRAVLDSAHVRVKKGADELAGSSHVDQGKPGSRMLIVSDADGLTLVVGLSAGNTHDREGLKPMVEGHQTRHSPYLG